MKAARSVMEVRDMLAEEGLLEKSSMVECCGMPNEKIYRNMADMQESSTYFSLIIVKDRD